MIKMMNRISSTAMLAVAFMLCATTSAWAVYEPGDTVTWSNTGTANTISSTEYNECNFDFCIPASDDLPAGSIVRITSIKLASVNTTFNGNKDPYKLRLNNVVSEKINGTGSLSDATIASNSSSSDKVAVYNFNNNCYISVGRNYPAATGNSAGGAGAGLAIIHSNGDATIIYGGGTDLGVVRYVQTSDSASVIIPYPSTSSTSGKGKGKEATDAGYYPVYEIQAEVVSIAGVSNPSFVWDVVNGSVTDSSGGLWASSLNRGSNLRIGPGGSGLTYDVGAARDWKDMVGKGNAPFSFTLYADIEQIDSSKGVILAFGSKNNANNRLALYRDGTKLKLTLYDATGSWNALATAELDKPSVGYHLISCVCTPSTGTVTLYVDNNANTATSESEASLGAGFQVGSVHGGVMGGLKASNGFALSKMLGYEFALTADDVATLTASYPATDGSQITSDIDPAVGGTLTVYASSATGNQYLGGSYATVTIPANNTVTVPHMRFLNREYDTDSVTLNINGTVNVTSVSDTYNVYWDGDYLKYKGILFGHYKGTGTYNVNSSGSLIAPNAWLQLVFSAGQQDLNINGGTVRVKGIFSDKANSASVTLKDGGVLEVNEIITNGQDFTRNFKAGTFRITADATETRAINFSAAGGYYTTLDPYGHTLTLGSGSVTGSGAIKVNSSAAGETKGKVVFNNLTTDYSGSITIIAGSTATLKAGNYAGTFNVEAGATLEIDPGSTYACAASFAGPGDVIVKSGTVSFSGSNTLTKGIQVDDGAVVTATTGIEGKISVLNGGTLKLTVASNDEIWYDGYVAADVTTTGSGAVEYYDVGGTKIVDGEYPDPKTSEATTGHFNGLNLLPYYYVWDPTRATSGSMSLSNTDLWRAGILPGDGTNVAIYVSGATTIDVDVDKFFGEVQVYGAGGYGETLTISGSKTITTPKLNVSAATSISGSSVNATGIIRNSAGMAMQGTVVCNAAIVGSGDLYVGDGVTESMVTFQVDCTDGMGNVYVMDKAVANVGVIFKAQRLNVFGSGKVAVTSGGALNLDAVSGSGTVTWTGLQPNSSVWKDSSTWTGTNVVMCVGPGRIKNLVPENWGRNGSYIVMKNLQGYIDTNDTTIQAKVIFEDGDNGYALALDDGYGGQKSYFREIAGSGTIKDVNERTDGGASQLFIFRKAVDYTGSIINLGTAGKNFTKQFFFSAEDTNPNGATYGRIVVESDGEAVIGDGNKWDTQYGTTLQGTLTLKGVATLEKGVTISGSSARINLAGSALTINNTLTASDATWTIGGTLPGAPTRSTPVTLITGLTAEPTLGTVTIAGLSDQYTVYAVEDSGNYNVVVRLKNDEWNSDSATEWTTTSFNGSSDYSDGINVYFGAIDAVAAKTVTISGTVSPANVTFRAGASTTYTLTGGAFSPSGTVAVESGTVVIESEMTAGVITVADGATLSLANATVSSISGAGTLNIPNGGVVKTTAANVVSVGALSGSGMLVIEGASPANDTTLQSLLKNSTGWTGTFCVRNLSTAWTDINPNNFGRDGSKVQLQGVTGYFTNPKSQNPNLFVPEVIFENGSGDYSGYAFKPSNGYSYSSSYSDNWKNFNVFSKISGSGTMYQATDKGYNQMYWIKDSSGFTGSIDQNHPNNNTIFVFAGNAATLTGRDSTYAASQIHVLANATATVGAGATWKPGNAIKISGTVELKGSATMANAVTLSNGAELIFDSANGTVAPLTFGTTATWPADGSVTFDISALVSETVKVPLIKRTGGEITNFDASRVTVVPPAGSAFGASRWTTYVEEDGDDVIYGVVVKPGTIFSVY